MHRGPWGASGSAWGPWGALRSAALQVLGSLGEFPGRLGKAQGKPVEVSGGSGRSVEVWNDSGGVRGGLGRFWECPGKV